MPKKVIYPILPVLLFLLLSPVNVNAIDFTEILAINKDGYGYITLQYSEKESVAKSNNFVIGTLPYSKEKIEEWFASPKTKIYSSKVDKGGVDNAMLNVEVTLNYGNVSDLGKIKALEGIRIETFQTDTGMVLRNIISPSFTNANSINQYYFSFKPEVEVRSSNGAQKGKDVIFFRPKGYIDGKTDIVFTATLVTGGKESSASNGNSGKKDDGGKSCGLFGFELPFILSLAYAFSMRRRALK
jgi:hypothetical protein